jgi:hypothetical protein
LLTRNHRQEGLCRAYVQAIAARCGMSIGVANPDYGIDLTLNEIMVVGRHRSESGYKLDVQAKSVAGGQTGGTCVRYDLDVRSYDALRHQGRCPRILVVLVLPKDESRWTAQTEAGLVLRHCADWLSLRARGPSPNRRSVRLSIPRANVFSVEALQGIMSRIKAGEAL